MSETIDDVLKLLSPNDISTDFTSLSLKPLEEIYKFVLYKLWDKPVFRPTDEIIKTQLLNLPLQTPESISSALITLLLKVKEFTSLLFEIRNLQNQFSSSEDLDDKALAQYFDYLTKLKELKDRWDLLQIIKDAILSSTSENL
ncbi:MAG: hypothetical protein QXV17_13490 [Candidatus Micrarchaeaceae archaeon]